LWVLGLTRSELGLVLFIVALVAAAGKLPQIGESIGAFLYRRHGKREPAKPGEPPPAGP
jgi:Sec-independent protein translocase protein TatA